MELVFKKNLKLKKKFSKKLLNYFKNFNFFYFKKFSLTEIITSRISTRPNPRIRF